MTSAEQRGNITTDRETIIATVAIVGSLDTKGEENAFIRDILNARGVDTIVVDTGVLGTPVFSADVSREKVARAGGHDLADLVARADRGEAIAVMAAGAENIVDDLYRRGAIDGGIALGGTGGTFVAARAFRPLPLGVPKLIVSTAASGNTEMYIGETDLTLMPSVADISGLNRISIPILTNAASAMAGMVTAERVAPQTPDRPLIAASMFGVTTPAVTRAREVLTDLGYEVIVFHMTGTGGRTLEALVEQGLIAGVFDVTTTELADHLVGGIFDAGPDRVTAAGRNGVPQVVSVGALDMVNFGPMETLSEKYSDRLIYQHNPTTTLMRTTPEECAELGAVLAEKLRGAVGPTTLFLPLRGISAIAVEGGPFYDPEADQNLFDSIRRGIEGSDVRLVEVETDVNDPVFAEAMAFELDRYIREQNAAATHRSQDTTSK